MCQQEAEMNFVIRSSSGQRSPNRSNSRYTTNSSPRLLPTEPCIYAASQPITSEKLTEIAASSESRAKFILTTDDTDSTEDFFGPFLILLSVPSVPSAVLN
jgi:hypothetical protein